jgi:hypothetical protein
LIKDNRKLKKIRRLFTTIRDFSHYSPFIKLPLYVPYRTLTVLSIIYLNLSYLMERHFCEMVSTLSVLLSGKWWGKVNITHVKGTNRFNLLHSKNRNWENLKMSYLLMCTGKRAKTAEAKCFPINLACLDHFWSFPQKYTNQDNGLNLTQR